MAKLIITDGVALLELSRRERMALGRKYIVFGLNQVLSISVEETPVKTDVGTKVKHGWVSVVESGEYENGGKSSFFVGPDRDHCVRIMLLNPSIVGLYLTFGDNLKVLARLKSATGQGFSAKEYFS